MSITLTELQDSLHAESVYTKNFVVTTSGSLTCADIDATLIGGTVTDTTAANWAALAATGNFTLTIDAETETVTPDFTGDSDMDAVAASIQTAIQSAFTGSPTCTWSTDHFIIKSANATPADAVMSYMTASTGVDLAVKMSCTEALATNLVPRGEAADARSMFTVTGDIAIKGLYGVVGTAFADDADREVAIEWVPTGGSGVELCDGLITDEDVSGSYMYITGTTTADMVNAALPALATTPLIIGAGVIKANSTESKAGTVTWTIVYNKIDGDATVTDAALIE